MEQICYNDNLFLVKLRAFFCAHAKEGYHLVPQCGKKLANVNLLQYQGS